jgi:hypothetical protein
VVLTQKGYNMNGDLAYQLGIESCLAEGFCVLVEHGEIAGPDSYIQIVEGIAAQIEVRGADSLSQKQKDVVSRAVEKFLTYHECPMGCDIEPDDIGSFLESGYCPYHDHQIHKDD